MQAPARSLVVLLVFCTNVAVQQTGDKLRTTIEKYVKQTQRCRNIPAISVAVVRGDQSIFSATYEKVGSISILRRKPTKFCIGGCTQGFTSTLLAQILSRNQHFSWDTPIWAIIGDWAQVSDAYRAHHATLRDLLAHKMGIPANDMVWFLNSLTRNELLRKLPFLRATKDFRSAFLQNNIVYTLAGKVAEKLGGTSWEALVKQKIFQPLGMTSSEFFHHSFSRSDYVHSYYVNASEHGGNARVDFDSLRSVEAVGPAASICSTSHDMARWMKLILNSGRTPGGVHLVEPWRLQETLEPEFIIPETYPDDLMFSRPTLNSSDERSAHSLGWIVGSYRGWKTVSQSGSLGGYQNGIMLLPHQKIGVWVATNVRNRYAIRLLQLILIDILLGRAPVLTLRQSCDFPGNFFVAQHGTIDLLPDPRFLPGIAVRPLADYSGQYGNLAYGNVTITHTRDVLRLSYGKIRNLTLKPSQFQHSFIPDSSHLRGIIQLDQVLFDGRDSIDIVTIPGLEPLSPPYFKKNLKMNDAKRNSSVSGGLVRLVCPQSKTSSNFPSLTLLTFPVFWISIFLSL